MFFFVIIVVTIERKREEESEKLISSHLHIQTHHIGREKKQCENNSMRIHIYVYLKKLRQE